MGRITEILDCEGPGFDGMWGGLFDAAHSHDTSGDGPLAAPRKLFDLAGKALQRWRPQVADILPRLEDVLKGRLPPRVLAGFCVQGFVTALFWECFDVAKTVPSSNVASCLASLTSGPVDTPEFGPLEFSQSSRWPAKVLDVRLLFEHWSGCLEQDVALCPDISLHQLRRNSGLHQEDTSSPAALAGRAAAFLQLEMQSSPPGKLLKRDLGRLPLVVVGSHLGSNMEPLALVMAGMQSISVEVDAVVYGTVYPFPELCCELFGHCARNAQFDEVISLLVRQMYRPQWEPIELMSLLNSALQSDQALKDAEMLLCAQPMPLCSLLRPLTDLPMLIYQAFPLIGATPSVHSHMVLTHFREMIKMPGRSTFVAYSEFLAAQFRYQAGQRPLCVRPHSLYATQTAMYDPDRENPRILVSRTAGWARDGAAALVNLVEAFSERDLRPGTNLRFVFLGMNRPPSDTVGGLSQPFGYPELRRYRAAVFFPWDMGMLLFSELYNMGVPMFVPSRSWMAAIIKRMLEYTDFGWWQARYNTATTLPNAPHKDVEVWPWLEPNSTIKEILELYDRTDFVRWPYVEAFSSLPDLTARLVHFDFDGVSNAMRQWNDKALPLSLSIIARAVSSLLDAKVEPPATGESSCI